MTTIVVPCYNEASRLDVGAFKAFVTPLTSANLVLVNDGSSDATLEVLNDIRSTNPARVAVLDLERNSGKAEAVRRGLLRALETEADHVGFWDADLATPFDALPSFVEILSARPSLEMVIGSRVRLLGRDIDRAASRHYAGRVFATAASLTLRLPVYDTQCGAKLFRVSGRLRRVLSTPFLSKWVFDVEIMARYGALDGRYEPAQLLNAIYEYPLTEWRDVAGSKVKGSDFVKSGWDLLRIHRAYIASTARPEMMMSTDTAASAIAAGPER